MKLWGKFDTAACCSKTRITALLCRKKERLIEKQKSRSNGCSSSSQNIIKGSFEPTGCFGSIILPQGVRDLYIFKGYRSTQLFAQSPPNTQGYFTIILPLSAINFIEYIFKEASISSFVSLLVCLHWKTLFWAPPHTLPPPYEIIMKLLSSS